MPATATSTPAPRVARAQRPAAPPVPPPALAAWLDAQRINTERYAAGLRSFRPHEFGRGGAAPTEAHRRAANDLIEAKRRSLLAVTGRIAAARSHALADADDYGRLQAFTVLKEQAQRHVEAIELIWDFYFRLFTQRQTRLGRLLLGTDRIGLDCYQAIYTRLGVARSIPSPPPFSYVKSGLGPATYRRRVVVQAMGRHENPFPLIELPYHRLLNPWALGAVPHEVAHNIQADLELWHVVPAAIRDRLGAHGVDGGSAALWAQWHKEMFADLCGTLLIGPSAVMSLTTVLCKSPVRTMAFNPRGVHPTPYLRVGINTALLRRMDFDAEADRIDAIWSQLYPARFASAFPPAFARSFARASETIVDTLCFRPYPQLGDRSLADVVRFGRNDQIMVEEAAGRLAQGIDPGIVPERFMIGAAHVAFDRRLAAPATITSNFYNALERR